VTDASHTASAAPPSFFELLVGPFRGTAVYRRAADGSLFGAFLVLLVGLLLGLALLCGRQMVLFSATLDAMADSAIAFMPRVNIENGWATVEADFGRVIETDRVVILFDTRPEPGDVPKGYGSDVRPRVLVGDRALLLYTPEREVPLALPWVQVNQAFGPRVSVNGPEFVDGLRGRMPRTVVVIGLLIAAVFLVWEVALIALLAVMYRVLFGRRLGAPSARRLLVVGFLASVPATAVGVVLTTVGAPQEWAFLAHGVVLGGLVLLGGNSLVGMPVPLPPAEGDEAPRGVATEL